MEKHAQNQGMNQYEQLNYTRKIHSMQSQNMYVSVHTLRWIYLNGDVVWFQASLDLRNLPLLVRLATPQYIT